MKKYVFLLIFVLLAGCQKQISIKKDNKGSFDTQNLKYAHTIPTFFESYHVQGLDIVDSCGFLSSIDKKARIAWIFKFSLKTGEIIHKRDITIGEQIHPGGIQYSGNYVWVPVAEYKAHSTSTILALDPNSLTIEKKFTVNDHIGAVAIDDDNNIWGANWDSDDFYKWDQAGTQLLKQQNPTTMQYQDMKYIDNYLYCCGHNKDTSAVDIYSVNKLEFKKRISLEKGELATDLAREGMAFYKQQFYFLPKDGPDSKIFVFDIN